MAQAHAGAAAAAGRLHKDRIPVYLVVVLLELCTAQLLQRGGAGSHRVAAPSVKSPCRSSCAISSR